MTTPFVYCTDEDISVRAPSDFTVIVPRDQCYARATDGTFGDDPWTLTSATNFATAGVLPGFVCALTGGPFKSAGDSLAIDSVSGTSCTLRRKGCDSRTGLPPGNVGASGFTFSICTFLPQIRAASYDLDRRYGVQDLIVGCRHSDLFDPAELKRAAVLQVLIGAYNDASRGSGVPDAASGRGTFDTWGAKADNCNAELRDLLDRVAVHWTSPLGVNPLDPPTTKFSMRISR